MAKIPINIKSGNIEKKEWVIGIDLGTTNSLVAVVDRSDSVPRALSHGEGGVIVPSLVHFGEGGDFQVGNSARPFLLSDPANTIYSAKRLMGKSYRDVTDYRDMFHYRIIDDDPDQLVRVKAGNHFYTPIELSARILAELKKLAERELHGEVKKAVITVPAYFNDSQRQATRDAGRLAGLDVLRIVNEPTAASLAYGIGLDPSEEKYVAVYDLGGGTFDLSILHIHEGIFDVLSTHGDTFLGGDDFDRAIVQHWMRVHEELSQYEGAQELRLLAEEAKRVAGDGKAFNNIWNGIPLALNYQSLNELMQPLLERTLFSCGLALKDAGLQVSDLSEVILVGGSTRSPLVKESVRSYFKGIVINDRLNPDEVVALGAAVEADILAGNRKDILLLDVTPLSLGIETMGGLMDVLIPRNNKVPCKAARQYTTSVDGQVNLRISVFQGERDAVKENRRLADFELKGIPAMPAGFPKVEITFMLDADGILRVSAEELRSGKKQEINIKPQYGLTDEEVERMLIDSLEHAGDDMKMRALEEARNEGRQLLYATDKFMQQSADELTEENVTQIEQLSEKLATMLVGEDKDAILAAQEALNDYCRPFAEKLMDKAVAGALKGKQL
jgi:molecular chaperone HscA